NAEDLRCCFVVSEEEKSGDRQDDPHRFECENQTIDNMFAHLLQRRFHIVRRCCRNEKQKRRTSGQGRPFPSFHLCRTAYFGNNHAPDNKQKGNRHKKGKKTAFFPWHRSIFFLFFFNTFTPPIPFPRC